MPPPKLTPDVVSEIHRRRTNGDSLATIAKALGISVGTVQNGLRKVPIDAPSEVPLAPDVVLDAPTLDEVRGWIALQVRDLRLECRKLQHRDPSSYAAASRNLTAASLALARLTTKPTDDPALHPDMVKAAEECRLLLHKLLDSVLAEPQSPFPVSPAREWMQRLAGVSDPHSVVDALCDACGTVLLAGLRYRWRGWWARPSQLLTRHGLTRTWGHCGGRRSGKTRAKAEAIRELIEQGVVNRVGFLAQNEDRTKEICIEGPSGLMAVFPPWDRPWLEGGQLVWSNGARGLPFTPQKPGNIRGDGVQVMWLTEIQSWPKTTMIEAMSTARVMCSTDPAIVMWDCTPKRRHVLLKALFADYARDGVSHSIVVEPIEANRDNLGAQVIDDLRSTGLLNGTQAGKEELDGIFTDEEEGALCKSEWIENARRDDPGQYRRHILSIDPAISVRKGSDSTGISDLALADDGQVLVLGDYTGKYSWEAWADLVLDRYVAGRCDCIVVERNRGGDAVAGNLRARGESPDRIRRGARLTVVVVDPAARTQWIAGTVYVKEINARGSKTDRAQPVVGLYEAGRVSHCRGADLEELEDMLLTWVPDPDVRESPDRLDPLVHGIWELVGLGKNRRGDTGAGLHRIAEQLAPPRPGLLASVLGGNGGRRL